MSVFAGLVALSQHLLDEQQLHVMYSSQYLGLIQGCPFHHAVRYLNACSNWHH